MDEFIKKNCLFNIAFLLARVRSEVFCIVIAVIIIIIIIKKCGNVTLRESD